MLETALDYGITEFDFWEMTVAEVNRAVQSSLRVRKIEAQEKAAFDYTLAALIGKYVSIIISGKGEQPTIEQAYPEIFKDFKKEEEEEIQRRRDEISALRFELFAQSYNKSFNKGVQKIDE